MTGIRFGPDISDADGATLVGGRSMADVLLLPEDQRQLMVWLLRQGSVPPPDIAQGLNRPEAEVQVLLDSLVEQGFVQMVVTEAPSPAERQITYQAQALQRQRASTGDLDLPALGADPLTVILSTSSNGMAAPDSQFELSLTIRNKGDQSAIVDVWVEDLPPALHTWCSATQERLALGADQSGEVTFQFDVPPAALPGTYPYWLVVDARQHYPQMSPLRYPQVLQVLPALQSEIRVNDPTFALQPTTRAAAPAALSPGEIMEVQVIVFNRGDRVDRFQLLCRDLPESWVAINYPQGFQQAGLALEESYLDLNPGDQGVISMLVKVPLEALARSYVATLKLQSENQPDLSLLELLYLTVRPVYQLDLTFQTLVSRVQNQPGLFAIQATNQGNTMRSLQLQILALEDNKLCTYTLEPDQLQLAPRQTQISRIWVKPTRGWKRPLFGGGRLVNFNVAVTDTEQHPLPNIPMQGFIVWEARPWWQILPFVLLGLGSLATLVWLVWWLLLRPPALPKILWLSSTDSEYSEANQDAVALGFQISHPNRIQSIAIVGQSEAGEVISGPLRFDLTEGLPAPLAPYCTWQSRLLTCQNLRTDARKAGKYTFTLTVIPKVGRRDAEPVQMSAPPVTLAPLPTPASPRIVAFGSSQPSYSEAPPALPASSTAPASADPLQAKPNDIRLQWTVAHPGQIKALQIVGRNAEGALLFPAAELDLSQGLPEKLKPYCTLGESLVCQNVPTGVRQGGTYTFELSIIPTAGTPEAPITQVSAPIPITPRPPKILQFLVNGQPAQPKYRLPIGQPDAQVVLSWAVEANPGTTVDLLPVPGTVALQGNLPLPLGTEPSSTVITLQVTNSAGEQITQSFALETFDPTPELPPPPPTVVVNTGEAAAGQGAAGAASTADAAGPPATDLSTPQPTDPTQISPQELPPQFELGN